MTNKIIPCVSPELEKFFAKAPDKKILSPARLADFALDFIGIMPTPNLEQLEEFITKELKIKLTISDNPDLNNNGIAEYLVNEPIIEPSLFSTGDFLFNDIFETAQFEITLGRKTYNLPGRQRSILAHELGHILRWAGNHIGKYNANFENYKLNEDFATRFAKRFTVPPALIEKFLGDEEDLHSRLYNFSERYEVRLEDLINSLDRKLENIGAVILSDFSERRSFRRMGQAFRIIGQALPKLFDLKPRKFLPSGYFWRNLINSNQLFSEKLLKEKWIYDANKPSIKLTRTVGFMNESIGLFSRKEKGIFYKFKLPEKQCMSTSLFRDDYLQEDSKEDVCHLVTFPINLEHLTEVSDKNGPLLPFLPK